MNHTITLLSYAPLSQRRLRFVLFTLASKSSFSVNKISCSVTDSSAERGCLKEAGIAGNKLGSSSSSVLPGIAIGA